MSRYAPGHRNETKARILAVAAALIRRKGIERVGVASVMEAAGLTHGGFYAHFASKEALLCEGIAFAGEESASKHRVTVAGAPAGHALARIVGRYLSRTHRDRPESGCIIAALVSEMPRQAPAARHSFTRRVRDMLGLLAEHSETPGEDATAMRVLATLVGSLELARAVDDRALSNRFLIEGKRAALRLLADGHAGTSTSAAT